MADPRGRQLGQACVGSRHYVITPHNTNRFVDANSTPIDGFVLVLSAGEVTVVDMVGAAVAYTISAVPFVIPLRARGVNSTGTNSTDLILLTD